MSDYQYGVMNQPPSSVPSNQYLPPNGQSGQGNPTGLPFMLSPNPYGDPNVDRSTVPAEALPGYDQYNSNVYGFGQALNNGLIQAGPQFGMNATTRESLANQIAAAQASQSQQSAYLNQDYATGLGRLGLQGDQLGIQRSNLGLDRQALGLQRNSLGFDLSSLGIQLGANARQPAYLTALHELANQGYNQNAATQTRGVNSSSTARGSFGSAGQRANLTDIQSTLANQLGGEAQRYYENMAQTSDQRQQLGIQGQRIGNQSQGLDLDAKRLDNQNAMLDIQSKSLGLDRNALQTELSRGLDRLGFSSFMSISDLTDKMNSSNIQDQLLRSKSSIRRYRTLITTHSSTRLHGNPAPTNPGMMAQVSLVERGRVDVNHSVHSTDLSIRIRIGC
jgi:hypothetical protein